MADDSTASDETAPAMPTLFISYASEDRAAARRLRDAIGEHGIDVWYDEDELTGGDAWDQKIRQRIRECDFFMPVISHATQARREGYFRREWRQAAERTLDMDDDMMFLLPVNIDNIPEAGARVPERFTQVHWTRCPAGEFNADLETLCDSMQQGHDAIAPTPSASPTKRPSRPVAPRRQSKGKSLPPYPAQPHRQADEAVWMHIFNLLVWIVQCAYRAYRGFPRILRWIVIIWFISFLFARCDAPDVDWEEPQISAQDSAEAAAELNAALEGESDTDLSGVGEFIGAVADAVQAGRTLALVPFNYTSAEPTNEAFTKAVFTQLLDSLQVTRDDQVALSPITLGARPSTQDLIARTARVDSRFLLTGWSEIDPEDQRVYLHVLLHEGQSPEPVWTQRFVVTSDGVAATVEIIRAAITTHEVFAEPAGETP